MKESLNNDLILIDINKHISDATKSCLHKYNHYYDSIETDVDIQQTMYKNNNLMLLLNNKLFHFINEIKIIFKNDFDHKIYFYKLPHELNLEIYSYLIDENSIKINLLNLDCLFVEKINYYILKDEVEINIKFKLVEHYFKKINKYMNVKEFQNQIPNYLLNEFKYGINIYSSVNRKLNIIIKNMTYNNQEFLDYENKFIKTITC